MLRKKRGGEGKKRVDGDSLVADPSSRRGDAMKGGVVKLGKSLRHSCSDGTWVMDVAVDMERKKKKKLGVGPWLIILASVPMAA